MCIPLQVNIDFESEADMVEKMRIGIALQPLATALFANSPFRDGSDTGAHIHLTPMGILDKSTQSQHQPGLCILSPMEAPNCGPAGHACTSPAMPCEVGCADSATCLLAMCALAGYVSWRSHVWTDVDPDRTGVLPFVWDKDFGFERYVEYALDVPMYFLYRGGKYEDATQQRCTFREYMEGKDARAPRSLAHRTRVSSVHSSRACVASFLPRLHLRLPCLDTCRC